MTGWIIPGSGDDVVQHLRPAGSPLDESVGILRFVLMVVVFFPAS